MIQVFSKQASNCIKSVQSFAYNLRCDNCDFEEMVKVYQMILVAENSLSKHTKLLLAIVTAEFVAMINTQNFR